MPVYLQQGLHLSESYMKPATSQFIYFWKLGEHWLDCSAILKRNRMKFFFGGGYPTNLLRYVLFDD